MTTIGKLGIVVLTTVAYVAVIELNRLLFSSFEFSTNVNWIFLPSGLRLAFVLVFGVWGATGIILGSIATNLLHYFNGDPFTAVVAGAISGLAPLLARSICASLCALDVNLRNLNTTLLLQAAASFAVLSAALHQLWFTYRGQSDHFISSTTAMATGDFVGTVLVLYTLKYLASTVPNIEEKLENFE